MEATSPLPPLHPPLHLTLTPGCVPITQNAYAATAINSTSFCTSARDAFVILVENALRVATINAVGDFVLFLGKVSVWAGPAARGRWGEGGVTSCVTELMFVSGESESSSRFFTSWMVPDVCVSPCVCVWTRVSL